VHNCGSPLLIAGDNTSVAQYRWPPDAPQLRLPSFFCLLRHAAEVLKTRGSRCDRNAAMAALSIEARRKQNPTASPPVMCFWLSGSRARPDGRLLFLTGSAAALAMFWRRAGCQTVPRWRTLQAQRSRPPAHAYLLHDTGIESSQTSRSCRRSARHVRLHTRFATVVRPATPASYSRRWRRSPERGHPFAAGTTSALLVSVAIGRVL
jgi:hypothetical protein